MLLSAHVTVGAAIGSTIGNPILGVIISFISYYLLNCIPHSEFKNFKNKNLEKIIKYGDILLSIVLSLLFAITIPAYISNTQSTLPNAYDVSFSTIALPFHNFSISILLLVYSFVSILPAIINLIYKKIKSDFIVFKWNNKAIKLFQNNDSHFLGKVIHFAIIVVFGLYSYRLIPNSDSPIFLQILLFIIIIVSFLAILETFSLQETPKESTK